jgi:hypothetical protein
MKFGSLIVFPFNALLEIVQGIQSPPLEFPDPTLLKLVDGNWVEVVELLSSSPEGGY